MSNMIAKDVIIGSNVKFGDGVVVKSGCILEDNVVLEDNVFIDYGTIIHSNVTIGQGSTIGCRCILGEYTADFYQDRENHSEPLVIGKGSLIRSECIVYGDNVFGDFLQTGHRVTIREKTKIGHHVRIGTLSDIQGYCEIGDYVNMHSNVHIGQHSIIKRYAWIFPYVVLTNDPNPPSNTMQGVTVEEFAVVATGTIVLPGKTIGNGALVGAHSTVTSDIGADKIAVGCPAQMRGDTSKIVDPTTKKQVYPWRYTFERGMPWEGVGYSEWSKNND